MSSGCAAKKWCSPFCSQLCCELCCDPVQRTVQTDVCATSCASRGVQLAVQFTLVNRGSVSCAAGRLRSYTAYCAARPVTSCAASSACASRCAAGSAACFTARSFASCTAVAVQPAVQTGVQWICVLVLPSRSQLRRHKCIGKNISYTIFTFRRNANRRLVCRNFTSPANR